jgi:hypothetical protein
MAMFAEILACQADRARRRAHRFNGLSLSWPPSPAMLTLPYSAARGLYIDRSVS